MHLKWLGQPVTAGLADFKHVRKLPHEPFSWQKGGGGGDTGHLEMGTPPADLAAAERGSVAMTISCRGASDIPASYPSPVISFLNANRNGLIVLRFRKILQSSEVLKFCQRTSKELQKGLILILTISKAVLCISKLDLFCFVLFYISSTNMTKTQ